MSLVQIRNRFDTQFIYIWISDDDLKEQVDKCIAMAPSCATVNNYAQLAHKFWEAAVDHKRACEKLVHDQHLQQQVCILLSNMLFIYRVDRL